MDGVFIAAEPENNICQCHKIQKGDIIRIDTKMIKGNLKVGTYVYSNKNDCNLNIYGGEYVVGKVMEVITFKTILKEMLSYSGRDLIMRHYILHPIRLIKFLLKAWKKDIKIECL